jgi:hypothetical protein
MNSVKQDIPVIDSSPELWLTSNAVAFILLMVIVFVVIFYGIQRIFNYKNIQQNWDKYRCDPAIMPFAAFYGRNTSENFNFCLGKIFTEHSSGTTSSFSSLLGGFVQVMSTLLGSINNIRLTVSTFVGGVNVIFQEFTDRITQFFFQIRISAIRIKNLIQRMYATMFSIIYMSSSAMTGITSFIKDVCIGDILLPTNTKVTSIFNFYADGQPMIILDRNDDIDHQIIVSTNHYIQHNNTWIMSGKHPSAKSEHMWSGGKDRPLICLNTDTHTIPIGGHIFRDYDETESADISTMNMIDNILNAKNIERKYTFSEYTPAVYNFAEVKMKDGTYKFAKNIQLGDMLSTNSTVIGFIKREISEFCIIPSEKCMYKPHIVSSATECWNAHANEWQRAGTIYPVHKISQYTQPLQMISFVTLPNSVIELKNNFMIRDYLEVCSPDSETYYTQQLESSQVIQAS